VGPAVSIADRLSQRVSQLPGRVLATNLAELTREHSNGSDSAFTRYHDLAQRLIQAGACTPDDLVLASMSKTLMVGVKQRWLPADVYDDLTAELGGDPDLRVLLSQIRREPPLQAKTTPLRGSSGGRRWWFSRRRS